MILGITGRGLSSRQRSFLRHKIESSLKGHAPIEVPIAVKVLEDLRKNQYSSLWYGGEIASVCYKGWRFDIEACGDVCAYLYRKVNSDDQILYVKDKNNAGRLGEELQQYIKTDKALYAAINGKHSKYELELGNNNWYECFVTDPQGEFYDLMWALDSDDALESIAEVIAGMDEVIADVEKEAG